jgi:hypothetical protein
MTTTSHPTGGSEFAALDRVLVDLGFGLITWGFRRAALRPARARARAAAHVRDAGDGSRPPSERAATDLMIHSHFGIR